MHAATMAGIAPCEIGQSIPPDTAHVSLDTVCSYRLCAHRADYPPQAVSVSLPTWKACVGYEEGEDWVVSKMKNGYPRCAGLVTALCHSLTKRNQVFRR